MENCTYFRCPVTSKGRKADHYFSCPLCKKLLHRECYQEEGNFNKLLLICYVNNNFIFVEMSAQVFVRLKKGKQLPTFTCTSCWIQLCFTFILYSHVVVLYAFMKNFTWKNHFSGNIITIHYFHERCQISTRIFIITQRKLKKRESIAKQNNVLLGNIWIRKQLQFGWKEIIFLLRSLCWK